MDHLVNKPYVNEVTLSKQNLSQKFYKSFELKVCFKRGLDLSKEILWVSVGQLAANLQTVKVGGLKKILPHSQSRTLVAQGRPINRFNSEK